MPLTVEWGLCLPHLNHPTQQSGPTWARDYDFISIRTASFSMNARGGNGSARSPSAPRLTREMGGKGVGGIGVRQRMRASLCTAHQGTAVVSLLPLLQEPRATVVWIGSVQNGRTGPEVELVVRDLKAIVGASGESEGNKH